MGVGQRHGDLVATSFFGGAFFNGEFFNSGTPTPPSITSTQTSATGGGSQGPAGRGIAAMHRQRKRIEAEEREMALILEAVIPVIAGAQFEQSVTIKIDRRKLQ